MKKLILILVVVLFSSLALAEVHHYYEIKLSYVEGEITLQRISVIPSPKLLANSAGNYFVELVSLEGEMLEFDSFEFPLMVLVDETDPETGTIVQGGMLELNKTEMIVYLSYHENAREIGIYDENFNLKLTIPVSKFFQEPADLFLEGELDRQVQTGKLAEVKKAGKIIGEKAVIFGIVIIGCILIYFLVKVGKRKFYTK